MNSTHDEKYEAQLNDSFRNLAGEIDYSINAYKVELKNFFASLSPALDIAKRAQAELDRTAATQFTVFKYFSKKDRTQEIYLSRIFGDFLDPSGTHGQGDRFLRLFLDELMRQGNGWSKNLRHILSNDALKECKVDVPFRTQEGREIDIVLKIRYKNRDCFLCIGVENKPWARDLERQIADYLKDLLKKCPGNACMLYFSGDGKEPSENSLEGLDVQERSLCQTVPYRRNKGECPSLEGWIQQCWEQCEAERVRWFLKDLLEYIERQFEIPA